MQKRGPADSIVQMLKLHMTKMPIPDNLYITLYSDMSYPLQSLVHRSGITPYGETNDRGPAPDYLPPSQISYVLATYSSSSLTDLDSR